MSRTSNAIMLLDLVLAGFEVSTEIAELFRRAESENRDVSKEELQSLRSGNEALFDEVMSKLG